MKKDGVFIAHSPESNMNLASGVAPINKFLDNGLRVGLATDVAGGSHESMLRAMTHAIQASKLRWRLYDQDVKPLSFERAFYLATMGGGAFFGNVGSFLEGYEFDAVVLDDASLDIRRNFPSAPGWSARPIWRMTEPDGEICCRTEDPRLTNRRESGTIQPANRIAPGQRPGADSSEPSCL